MRMATEWAISLELEFCSGADRLASLKADPEPRTSSR